MAARLRLTWTSWPARLTTWRKQGAAPNTHDRRTPAWRAARPLLVFAAAYLAAWSYLFVAAFLGAHPTPVPLFPPAAVLICALLLTSPRRWWVYLVASFVIQVPILAALHVPFWWNVLGFTPDAIQPLVAASLLRRFIGLPPRFASLREVTRYTICVVVAVALAATLGSAVNVTQGGEPYWPTWSMWFLSDALALLVLAPTLLLWIAAGFGGWRAGSRRRAAEAGALYGGLVFLLLVVFNTRVPYPETADDLIYLPVPLLLWAAIRFGPRGIASALSLIALLAVPAVANALGPFAGHSSPPAETLTNVFSLQGFLLVIGVPLLFLAALYQERVRVATALETSEVRYRSVVETQTELVTRFLPDSTITFVNEANCRSMGKTRQELVGTHMLEHVPAVARKRVQATIQALLEHPGIATIEHETLLPDGTVGWQQWVNRTILDREGRVVELQGIGRDITERKRLEGEREAARVEAERRAAQLEATFEAMADGVAVYDARGHLVQENTAQRRLWGLDAAPLDYAELSLPERMALFVARDEEGRLLGPDEGPLPRALRGEVLTGAETMDLRSHTLDGREVELSVSAAPLRDHEGRLTGAVAVFRDQTERNQLAREREEARASALAERETARQMSDFLSLVGHELRNPLTSLKGQIQLAQRQLLRLEASEEALLGIMAEMFQRLRSPVWQLEWFINDLVEAAQLQRGQFTLVMRPCDLAAVVREVVEAQRAAWPARTMDLRVPEGEAIMVRADAKRVGQVVTNYLTNALKYTPSEGPIALILGVEADQARLLVRDQGPGIPLEEQAQIWEQFHRGQGAAAQSSATEGLGLGLYLCMQLIERQGGQVGLESQPGTGSTFWFSLPLAAEPS